MNQILQWTNEANNWKGAPGACNFNLTAEWKWSNLQTNQSTAL